ncbi:MAG: lipocalin-like domain-containing protein [Steroidobacteraceae bacterium]
MRGGWAGACAVAVLTAAAGTAPTPGPTSAGGFAQALAPRAFVFPRDHGPHPEFRQEWWYLTGNLEAPDGARFGFELTFFRVALAPEGTPAPASASAWRARQIYVAHFAITDAARGRFASAQKLERDALGLAGAQSEPLKVWVDDWSLSAEAGVWRVSAAQAGYGLELELTPLGPPTLNGDAGLSVKAAVPGDATYYYSIPRISAAGRIVRDGHAIPVKGLAWFDREWGSGGLGADEVGWDWFGLQLADGSSFMFYTLRDRGGGRDPHSAGTWVDTAGKSRALSSAEVQIEVTGHWTDGRGVRYPARWRIRVPTLALDLAITPVLSGQELDTTPRYWEGAVEVAGTRNGERSGGRGYVELVGYARDTDTLSEVGR